MTKLIRGKPIADRILNVVSDTCKRNSLKPGLAVIQVGEDPASTVYVNKKAATCQKFGFYAETYRFPDTIQAAELKAQIDALNADPKIHGILVQSPLPKHIPSYEVIQWILPEKDVDGFHPINVGKMASGMPVLAPTCTPYGIIALLSAYDISLKGKQVMVLGRSHIVGMPMSLMLIRADATVFWCHRRSVNHRLMGPYMDIIISATGVPRLVGRDWVSEKTILVDVGINRVNNKLVGDVAVDEVDGVVAARTPVPGGVGPLTIAVLLRNAASLALGKPINIMNLK